MKLAHRHRIIEEASLVTGEKDANEAPAEVGQSHGGIALLPSPWQSSL